MLVVQLNDVFQYAWGKLIGRRVIAPAISPNKTWEGFVGGVASATLVGTALWWATPFKPWHAAGLSLVISVMGFAGGMVMSAIKRDRGVKDYGTLVVGHGGVLGPHRLDLLRRPDLLPPHPVLSGRDAVGRWRWPAFPTVRPLPTPAERSEGTSS